MPCMYDSVLHPMIGLILALRLIGPNREPDSNGCSNLNFHHWQLCALHTTLRVQPPCSMIRRRSPFLKPSLKYFPVVSILVAKR